MIELCCRPPGLRPTTVRIGAGPAGGRLGAMLAERFPGRRAHLLVDRRVAATCPAAAVEGALWLEAGEELKSFLGLEGLLRALLRRSASRGDLLVAVGGGSLGDLAGLAAALLLRGLELCMVPTTLVAMVDSSVGGKTAINLPEGKNLVGALWPATEVWIDPGFAATLPESEWRSGLGEVLKIAIGLEPALFELCERSAAALLAREPAAVSAAADLALRAKIRIVELDPLEQGPRRLLNLGHTLGHALEAWSGFRIPHGVAVARGLHHVLDLAERRGTMAADAAARARNLLRRFGFEADPLPPRAALLGYLGRDKKVAGGQLHAVLPTAIGASCTVPMEPAAFVEV